MFRYHAVDEKERAGPILCRFPLRANLCVLLEYLFHLMCELVSVACGEFESGFADDFAEAADV
jgi:hypothetical protein